MKNNIQLNQTIILSLLLLVWIEFYSLNISYLEIFTTFFTVILLDSIFLKRRTWKWTFPFSWVNIWFWIAFFLRSGDLILYIFAWLLAVIWKNIFKVDGKHFMNPSNMWVFLTLILFPKYSWINTLQWWSYSGDFWYKYFLVLFIVFIFWLFILNKVKKIFKYNYLFDLVLPFIVLHSLLFFIIPYNESFTSFRLFFSVSFFIFTFFMLTDPKTVPRKGITRVFYSFSIVFTFYILQFFINEWYSLLWALFFNTLLLPFIWNNEIKHTLSNKASNSIIYYLIIIFIQILLVLIFIKIFGQPDLLFNNLCNQLFCK